MLQMDDEKLKELFYQNKTLREIAKHFDCSTRTVSKRITKLNLVREKVRSYEDLTGQKFNRITAIKYIRLDKFGKAIWLFKCDCGREKELNASAAKANLTTSCGCIKQKSLRRKGYELLSAGFYTKILKNAHSRDYVFEYSMKELWDLYIQQDKKCAITKVPITIYPDCNKEKLMTASLDRIDSNLGYVKGNVQWVHKRVNRLKNILSMEELVFWCRKIVDNSSEKDIKDFDVNILTWD